MTEQEAIDLARSLFLRDDNLYGCAETTSLVLEQAYGLPVDVSPAMALNGGVGWSGGVCGAISAAALVAGRLAARKVPDHKQAKSLARSMVAELMHEFQARYGATDCRQLTGLDISTAEGHAAFLAAGKWRTDCMDQIAFVIRRLLAAGADLNAGSEP